MKWLIVGLGNPGDQYKQTRHNVGFMVVEEMGKKIGNKEWRMEKKFNGQVLEAEELLLLKPQTFMNESGRAVAAAARFYKIPVDHIIVVHDDLDILWGTVKAGMEKGPKVHNGLGSIEQQLGSTHFWRVRVGIENRTREEKMMWPGEKYVLLPLKMEDFNILKPIMANVMDRVSMIVKENL